MTRSSYFTPHGGLPAQTQLLTDRALFSESHAVIPRGVLTDIVTSALPFWTGARFWVLARPLSGFAETFSQYIGELLPGGGSERPETQEGVEAALFVMEGTLELHIDGALHDLAPGGFAYLPPDRPWALHNRREQVARFHWIRKRYQSLEGLERPPVLIRSDTQVVPTPMPDCDGVWATTRFMEPEDLRFDMHISIVTFQPGGVIPFAETHVMEHGLYILQGKAVYRLNQDWVEVEAGDFIWLRAFCPQACYAGGPEPFRYLLYKDVNRHMAV